MSKNSKVGVAVVSVFMVLSLIIIFLALLGGNAVSSFFEKISKGDGSLYILSSIDNMDLEDDIVSYARKEGFKVEFKYLGDLDITAELNTNPNMYDAVWISNSVWLYMLKDEITSEAKSISVSPVVMGIKKSKAKELNLIRDDLTNSDLLELIKNKKIKYVMSSVTQTNDGASSYLGFLNALAGSPSVLTESMLDDPTLIENMKDLFKGVERVSGDQNFLEEMFINGNTYEAVIASESSLININKKLKSAGREELYLLYPMDGVPINDSKLAFINHYEHIAKKENYLKLLKYLRSKEGQKSIKELGRRTWYGGVSSNEDDSIFNDDWGIKTDKYLTGSKFPGESVISKALNLYIEELRKPSHTVFCLDYSGSMSGSGIESLRNAMQYILDYEQASADKLQFSKHDKITVLPFSSYVLDNWQTTNGKDTSKIIDSINMKSPTGGTAIYSCSAEALKILNNESDEFIKTIIVMTDGENTIGNMDTLTYTYNNIDEKIPIYSIMFGSADESELLRIAHLTNARVFDGRYNLLEAFKEVRGYN